MNTRGSFTMPGESGHEALTLRLAERWGADVIRDSDGTALSPDIINAGHDIYSTLCLIRADNAWARANPDALQMNYLMSMPVTATGDTLTIDPLEGFFREQFALNTADDPKRFWQVFDRTSGREVRDWRLDAVTGLVTIASATAWHSYTVNFLAVRLWEEISMYNHITNSWGDKERLMAVDPRYPKVREHLLAWLERWCAARPDTDVVRFTSLFYNFCWFWGDDPHRRNIFTDWGSYDFAVSPAALRAFEEKFGYTLRSEDFVRAGRYNATHNVPSQKLRDWMSFVADFVLDFGRQCVDIVHRHGKKAFVFYDDSWIGLEPYGPRFAEFGFDGLIKCVFNGFEARKCAGVTGVTTRELRLHPYLFPTGLKGEPTFSEGGHPALDARRFWLQARRALLRVKIDRIGLGGYLHLVEAFPDFCHAIAGIADEFRVLKSLHENGAPHTLPVKVGVLTAWGKLRSWICSGHLHEHPEVDLTNILEALSGLPVDVIFLDFDELKSGCLPEGLSVLLNAGIEDSAWSGGDNWKDAAVIEAVRKFVHGGGGLIGVNQPSAARHGTTNFQLADVLGVDRDTGDRICFGRYRFDGPDGAHPLAWNGLPACPGVFVTGGDTVVAAVADDGSPSVTSRACGAGRAVYLSGYRFSLSSARLLLRAVLHAAGQEALETLWIPDNPDVECAYYPADRKLVVINNSELPQTASVNSTSGGRHVFSLAPFEMQVTEEVR